MDSPLASKQILGEASEYAQSPGGVSYVLKDTQNVRAALSSPKFSPYPSKTGVSKDDIDIKIDKASERRQHLTSEIVNKNREHLNRVKEVRKTVAEKEENEKDQKLKNIQNKMSLAEEKRLRDLELIKDKCAEEERKVELAKRRAAEMKTPKGEYDRVEN